MSDARADGPRATRRGLLTLAALAAVPAACSRTAPPAPPAASPSAAPPAPSPTPAPGTTAPVRPSAAGVRPKATAPGTGGRGGAVPATAGRVKLGSYLDLRGRSLTESLALRRRQLGRDQSIVHEFWEWGSDFQRPAIGDTTLMISWHGVRHAEITGGGSDRLIARAARNLVRQGRPTLLRWGWEMNGNWFAWDGSHNGRDPGGYVDAWRRIHRIFADEGARNVAWVWSPNWNSGPNAAWNAMERYYPGDAYVDWVGVSGYPFDGEAPGTLFGPIAARFGDRKPIMITETAAIDHGGNTKAEWIGRLADHLRATPAIAGLVWFDTDTHPGAPDNFRIDSSDAALAAYRRMARLPHFAG